MLSCKARKITSVTVAHEVFLLLLLRICVLSTLTRHRERAHTSCGRANERGERCNGIRGLASEAHDLKNTFFPPKGSKDVSCLIRISPRDERMCPFLFTFRPQLRDKNTRFKRINIHKLDNVGEEAGKACLAAGLLQVCASLG